MYTVIVRSCQENDLSNFLPTKESVHTHFHEKAVDIFPTVSDSHEIMEARVDFAVYRYQCDLDLSLAKAAALAGVSFERMKEILSSRELELRLEAESLEEAQEEVATMERWFDEGQDAS